MCNRECAARTVRKALAIVVPIFLLLARGRGDRKHT